MGNLFTEVELQEIENFFEEYKLHGGKVFDHETGYEEIDPAERQVRAMNPYRYSPNGNLIHGSGLNRTTNRWRRTFVGHYIDEASEQVARYYKPVLDMQGREVGNIKSPEGGGPCGDGWMGAVH